MDFSSAWAAIGAWLNNDKTLSGISALGTLGAAIFAAYSAALSRAQHLEAQAGRPSIELPNTHPLVQIDVELAEWQGSPYCITIRNVGSGAIFDAQVLWEVRTSAGQRARALAPAELLTTESKTLSIRASGEEVYLAENGIETRAFAARSHAKSDVFAIASGGTVAYYPPRELLVWLLAELISRKHTPANEETIQILRLSVKYSTAGGKRRKTVFDVALAAFDVGAVPVESPRAVGANYRGSVSRVR